MSSLNMWRNRLAKASIKSGIFTPEATNWKTCARNLSTRRACFDYNSLIKGDTFSIAVCEVKLYSPSKVCRGSISVWLRNIRSRHGIGSRSCRPMCSSFSTSSYKAMSSLYEEDATAIESDVCMDEDDESDFSCQPKVPYGVINLALDAVVKVFTVNSTPNYFLPWQNKPQREVTGSGFVVPGQRILTNAHVVADQTYVLLRKHGVPTKFRAKVEAVGHECDLALLSVEDEKFWDGMHMLELGDIPNLQESVAVVGYPQGGDNISVTRGVVSRVEPVQYVHGASHLMAIQIDAAINPGNSGGPALMEDKVVGVVFQNLSGAENIGYIIPVPVISHFLADVEDNGQYIGFCALGLTCQATENSQLREHFKLPKDTTGVLVNKVHPLTDTSRYIQKDDMLLSFDGIPIANDGSVHFRNRERISFHHFVSMKKAGETALVQVLRCGQELEFHVKLGPLRLLVPIHQFDKLPSYYIFAGLVFVPLTLPYLHEYGDDWFNIAPRKLCDRAFSETPKKPGEQLVILSQVLVDDINSGYERLAELQVKSINGIEILNLHQLKEVVEGCKEEDIRFDLDDNRVVVLNYEAAKEASRHILERHRIAFPMSQDLTLDPPENELAPWEIPDVVNDKTKSMASMAL